MTGPDAVSIKCACGCPMDRRQNRCAECGWYLVKDFCGCCGAECSGLWCKKCAEHLGPSGTGPWDRTYYSTTGKECPYQK